LGGKAISDATLHRFYTIHFVLPFIILSLSAWHVVLLHRVGSSEPLGLGDKSALYMPFYPYGILKDLVAFWVYILVLMYFVHFEPMYFAHPENLVRANPLVTPRHIVPEWYFLTFYAILRAIPNKTFGIVAMFGSILVLFLLPYLDKPKAMGTPFKPSYKFAF